MPHRTSLLLFLIVTVGGGLAVGYANTPGEWYAQLAKPPFNPPDWIFAPVWTALYILIAVAGWRLWRRDRAGTAMTLWSAQLAVNFLWSPTFFSAHRIGLALGIILLLLALIAGFILTARRTDRIASWLFAPYAAWVGFAALLNGSILVLN